MNKVKGIPYGISDFNRMRNDNFTLWIRPGICPLLSRCPAISFDSSAPVWEKRIPKHDAYLL